MFAQIKLYLYGVGAMLLAMGAAMLYRKGRQDVKKDLQNDDYENAEDIRRRVSVDRADRMRKLDGAGWRD